MVYTYFRNSPVKNCSPTQPSPFSSLLRCNLFPMHPHWKIKPIHYACTWIYAQKKNTFLTFKANSTYIHLYTFFRYKPLTLLFYYVLHIGLALTTLHLLFANFFFNVHPYWCTPFWKDFNDFLLKPQVKKNLIETLAFL